MFSLNTRLLASYVLLLVVTLTAITLALGLLLSNQPAPPEQTYERLSALLRGLNASAELPANSDVMRQGFRQREELVINTQRLDEFSETSDVRVMSILFLRSRVLTLYDTEQHYQRNDPIRLAEYEGYNNSTLERWETAFRLHQLHGEFKDIDDSSWLFSGLALLSDNETGLMFLVAEPRPVRSLQATLVNFGRTLFVPVAQAALSGLMIAILLATLISSTITRPLRALSSAASAVAEGDLDQRVPVSGPPEVRAVAGAFNRMSTEVRNTQSAQRDFMANVSHDLKTPLTSIQGYSQAIMDGATNDPVEAAAIIHDEAERLNRMVAELSDLTRLQAGQLSMQMSSIDIGQLTTAVAQKLAVVAKNAGVTLHVTAPSLPSINGDGDRLVQVLNNLIGNAIKYTPEGGHISVVAALSGQGKQRGVEVIVRDTGVGIPEKDLPRIFERFYQVDKARGPRRGTGLGLAITHEIVLAHGGRIDVQSAQGKGAQFTVWLPSQDTTTIVRPRSDLLRSS